MTTTFTFFIRSDLYVAGRYEDGGECTAEVFYIVAEDNLGHRYVHPHRFYSSREVETTAEQREMGGPVVYFTDEREEAQAAVEALLAREQARAAKIGVYQTLDGYGTMDPAYGSPAYRAWVEAHAASKEWLATH